MICALERKIEELGECETNMFHNAQIIANCDSFVNEERINSAAKAIETMLESPTNAHSITQKVAAKALQGSIIH